jgi:cobalt-zinc-cadmium efflux system outer membrane protein
MRTAWIAAACCAVMGCCPPRVFAQPLTLSDVIARARQQAPRVVSARLAVEEARARMSGATVRPSNPDVEGAIGSRRGAGGKTIDLDIGVSQRFEPSGRRDARVAAVDASIAQAEAELEQTSRRVMLEAVGAYLRVFQASERERLLGAAETLAAALHDTADRRFRAGDVAVLDVNVARAALARVRADRQATRASRAGAIGELRLLLGLDGDVLIAGGLPEAASRDTAALLQSALERPELRSLEAAVREAEASVRLGQTFDKMELGAGARYARDSGDNIISGLFTVTLPVFARGQELIATGTARASRLRADLESLRQRVQNEVRTAAETLERRREALRILELDALPAIDENESLAAASYDAGQIGLAELLLIRREILDTRFQYLDARLEAARARLELDAAAGVLR